MHMKISTWHVRIEDDTQSLFEIHFPVELDTFDLITMSIPGGAYTTFRTYQHNNALRLQDHLERLNNTAELAGVSVRINQAALRGYIRTIVDQYDHSIELRIRIVLDLVELRGDIYLMCEPLKIPVPQAYLYGVKLITCKMRRSNPKAKLTQSISMAEEIRAEFDEGVHEAIMVDDRGHILEGLTSNFFAVKEGELWTDEHRVLSGITRSLVLEAARIVGIKVNYKSISLEEIPVIDEAFITSSSRGILPVVEIDRFIIADGSPGEITIRLSEQLDNLIQREIEEI